MSEMNLQKIVIGLITNPQYSLSKLDPAYIKEEPVRVALTSLSLADKDPNVRAAAVQYLKIAQAEA